MWCDEESKSKERPTKNDQEEKRMHDSLRDLTDRYEEMAK